MKFTIVTPSFNKGDYIQRTIESVLSQCNQNIKVEYLIFDNFSTDCTSTILEKFASSPEVNIIQQKDKGQFDAINQGWSKGTGDILAWLNADDVYLDSALSKVAEFFEQNPDVVAIYGESLYLDSNDKILKQVTNIRDYSPQTLLHHDFITQPATFIRKSVFESVGPLSGRYKYVFDWEYWIRISQRYKFVRVPFKVAGYRITDTNLTTTGRGKRFREMLNLVWTYGGMPNSVRFIVRLIQKYVAGEREIPLI